MRGSCTRCGAVHPRHPSGMCPSELVLWKKDRPAYGSPEAARLTAEALIKIVDQRCEHCGDPAQEATYEGRWLCDSCLYLAEFDTAESRCDRAYDAWSER